MKSMKKILFTVLTVCSMLLLAGCGKKEPMTAEEFAAHLEKNGFVVSVTPGSEYEWRDNSVEWDYKEDIETVIIAGKAPYTELQFYVWKDEAREKEWFEKNYKLMCKLEEQGFNKLTEEKNTDDYFKFTVQAKEGFAIYTRAGNTTMHVSGYNDSKKDVEKALKGTAY